MAERFVDAALNNKDGSLTANFFLGDQFVVYDYNVDRVNDGVHPITELGFPQSFTPVGASLDAALKGRKQFADKGYHFRGTDYARFLYSTASADQNIGALSAWALPAPFNTGVEAAFNGHAPTRDGKAYFFKGTQYVRYDWPSDKPDPGYPTAISNNMIGVGAPFTSGIDAAVDGAGSFEFYSYMFREDRYLRFNWNPSGGGEPQADQPHKSIQDNWPGLAELLLAGKAKTQARAWVDAAKAQVNAYLAFLAGTPFPYNINVFNAALATHFHVPSSATTNVKKSTANQILTAYNSIATTLDQSVVKFRFRTDSEAIADGNTTVPHAYTFQAGTVNFTKGFVTRGPMNRAASVLHECVHVFDNLSGSNATHIPEWYLTDAAADAVGLPHTAPDPAHFDTRYDLMITSNAVHNPSSYAAFAQHVAIGADTRYGMGKPTL